MPESAAGDSEESESEGTELLEDVCMEILRDLKTGEKVFDSMMDLSLRGADGRLRLALHLSLGCSQFFFAASTHLPEQSLA